MSQNARKKFSYGISKKKQKELTSWKDLTNKVKTNSSNKSVEDIWSSPNTSPFKALKLNTAPQISAKNDPFGFDDGVDEEKFDDLRTSPKKSKKKLLTPSKIKKALIVSPVKKSTKPAVNISGKKQTIAPDSPNKKPASPKTPKKMVIESSFDSEPLASDSPVRFVDERQITVVEKSYGAKKQALPNKKKKASGRGRPKKQPDVKSDINGTENIPSSSHDLDSDLSQQLLSQNSCSERLSENSDAVRQLYDNEEEKVVEKENSENVMDIVSSAENENKINNSEQSSSSQDTNTSNKNNEVPKIPRPSLFSCYNKGSESNKKSVFAKTSRTFRKDDDDFEFGSSAFSSQDSSGRSSQEQVSNKRKMEDGLKSPPRSPGLKSPFKSYKTVLEHRREAKRRRFSALPTDQHFDETIAEGKDNEDENKDSPPSKRSLSTTILGFPTPSYKPLRVPRKYKDLYVIVKNTKRAHEIIEDGQTQQLEDDIEYLLGGLTSTQKLATRCTSAIDLAVKCTQPNFIIHVKAHSIIPKIFACLADALQYEKLALCTATIMYTLVKQRSALDFNQQNIEFLIKLLSKKRETSEREKEDHKRVKSKIISIFETLEETNIEKENINAVSICRETLLSMTTKRVGAWFKDGVRELGAVDHLIDTIYELREDVESVREKSESFHTMERCLRLLGDVTVGSSTNQSYLVSYREGSLIETCIRIATIITRHIDLEHHFTEQIQACLFAVLKLLTDLSHECASSCTLICKQERSLNSVLRCALYIPRYLDQNNTFNFIAMSLGLLINVVEHSEQNTRSLNVALSPACYEHNTSFSNISTSEDDLDNHSAVESLTYLFLARLELCKEADLINELDSLEEEEAKREKSIHYQDDEFELVCGDRFDDTALVDEGSENCTPANEDCTPSSSQEENEELSTLKKPNLSKDEKKDIKNTLDKAHEHMENSHVAAYSALLIGLLLENHEENQEVVRDLLPDGNFTLLKDMLVKIMAFMKITCATNEAGLRVIERVIDVFRACADKFPAKTASSCDR